MINPSSILVLRRFVLRRSTSGCVLVSSLSAVVLRCLLIAPWAVVSIMAKFTALETTIGLYWCVVVAFGLYANNCPRCNQHTHQKNSGQRSDQNTPARGSAQNKTPQNQNRGRVNHVTAESVPEDTDMVFGMFLINSIHHIGILRN